VAYASLPGSLFSSEKMDQFGCDFPIDSLFLDSVLGFNGTMALAVKEEFVAADEFGLTRIVAQGTHGAGGSS
jgi:hypothetical protein